eukprot:1341493-Amorphochlora_amoeboformis.AAC.1
MKPYFFAQFLRLIPACQALSPHSTARQPPLASLADAIIAQTRGGRGMTPCRLDARRYGFPRKTGWIVVAVTVLLQCAFISRFEKKGRLRFCPGHPLYEMKEELFKKYQHSFPNIRWVVVVEVIVVGNLCVWVVGCMSA